MVCFPRSLLLTAVRSFFYSIFDHFACFGSNRNRFVRSFGICLWPPPFLFLWDLGCPGGGCCTVGHSSFFFFSCCPLSFLLVFLVPPPLFLFSVYMVMHTCRLTFVQSSYSTCSPVPLCTWYILPNTIDRFVTF